MHAYVLKDNGGTAILSVENLAKSLPPLGTLGIQFVPVAALYSISDTFYGLDLSRGLRLPQMNANP